MERQGALILRLDLDIQHHGLSDRPRAFCAGGVRVSRVPSSKSWEGYRGMSVEYVAVAVPEKVTITTASGW